MTIPEFIVMSARDRARKLDNDARASVCNLLDSLMGTADDRLALWARDHEAAAFLRERWTRDLVAAAAKATAPIWTEVDATLARNIVSEGLRYQDWAENGAPFDDLETRKRPERLAEWRKRADQERAAIATAETWLANYTRVMPGSPDEDEPIEEGPWTIYSMLNENGRSWAVSVVLSSPELHDDTRAEVWEKLDTETARRKDDKTLVAELKDSPNEWAISLLTSALWEWLGGWYDNPEPDDGPVSDGFEVVSRWNDGEQRWRIIRPAGPPRYLRAFTRDLWRSRWQAEAAEAIRGHRYTPALIRPVHADLADALTLRPMDPAQLTLPGLVPVISGAAEAISRAMRKAEALSPTAAHHLIRWLVRAAACAWDVGPGHEARIGDDAFARRLASGVEIEIVGGFDGLRNAIGMSSKKTDIRSIIEILASHSIPWAIPNREGRGPLLSFDNTQARPGIQARLIIGLSPLLCPGLASEKSVLQSDKVLIPCLPPPKLPTGGRSHGPLLTLDWLAIMDMGTRRMELLTAGGVRLDWPRLADRAGVSSQALRRTLDLWLDPAEGRWAMPAEGLYRLADRGQEGHAHRLLIDGATMSSQAAIAGKNAAAKRESARSRQK